MVIGSILLGFALLVLVVLVVARPFMVPRDTERKMTRRQTLAAKKEVVLDQLQSLDFEFETGKMPDDVYQTQRAHLLGEASEMLREIELLGGRQPDKQTPTTAVEVDDAIENAIARYRKTAKSGGSANGKKGFCPKCGQPADADDRFCAGCGQELLIKKPA